MPTQWKLFYKHASIFSPTVLACFHSPPLFSLPFSPSSFSPLLLLPYTTPPPPPDLLSRWNTWVRSTSRQRQQSSSTSDSFSRYADYHRQVLSWYIVSQRLCTLFPPAVIIGTRLLCACETPSQGWQSHRPLDGLLRDSSFPPFSLSLCR